MHGVELGVGSFFKEKTRASLWKVNGFSPHLSPLSERRNPFFSSIAVGRLLDQKPAKNRLDAHWLKGLSNEHRPVDYLFPRLDYRSNNNHLPSRAII